MNEESSDRTSGKADKHAAVPEAPNDMCGETRFMGLAIGVGAFVGLIGVGFHLAIERLLIWPETLAETLSGPILLAAAAGICALCALIALAIVRNFEPKAAGSGIQEIEGTLLGKRTMRWQRLLPVKFFGGLIALGSGMVLGREGPTVHMGAAVGGAFGQGFRLSKVETNGLLAAGAAAGLACAFNAPLGAVLFVLEEMREEFKHSFKTYLGLGSAVLAATYVTQVVIGTGTALPLSVSMPPLAQLPAFMAVGALMGVLGVLLNAGILRALDLARRVGPYPYAAFVGASIGALVILVPEATTGGEKVILALTAQHMAIGALLMLAALRFATTVFSYSSGVPGGIFAPILTLAVCVGLACGEAARLFFPEWGIEPIVLAICAMGGLFAASVRAPMVGIVLTLELTGSYEPLLAVMVTCIAAEFVAQKCGGRPIYSQLLDRTLAIEASAGKSG